MARTFPRAVAVAVVLALLMTGCGGDDEDDEGAAPSTTVPAVTSTTGAEGASAELCARAQTIMQLADGVTLEQAMAAEDPTGLIEGQWGTDLAAPGGADERAITFDLEPGSYGMICWIPSAGGTPHAFLGMAVPFTVS